VPNGLRVSRAAPIDRGHGRAESNFQKSYDLGAAKRRRLHALVSPRLRFCISLKRYTVAKWFTISTSAALFLPSRSDDYQA